MQSNPIFYDPTGRRRRWVTHAGALIALLGAVSATLFVLSLLVVPLLPRIPGVSMPKLHARRSALPILPPKQERQLRYALRQSRLALWKEVARTKPYSGRKKPSPVHPVTSIVGAFYATWQETGIHSLRANADNLTHLFPEWLHLDRAGTGLDAREWNPGKNALLKETSLGDNPDVLKVAREYHIQVHPILNNAEDGVFDPKRVERLLDSSAAQESLALSLRDFLLREHFGGVNVDFESLRPQDYRRLPGFLQTLRDALHPAGLAVSLDLEASSVDPNDADRLLVLQQMTQACDFVVLMAYDEHWGGATPGPIASVAWYYQVLQNALKQMPASKLVVGLGNYGYNWAQGEKRAHTLTYQEALTLARDYHYGQKPERVIDFDPDALNATFDYADDRGKSHQVWMLDAVSAYDQWLLGQRAHVRGSALWLLGEEDPGVWSFLDRELKAPPSPHLLESVSFPYGVEFDGNGEILSVTATPQEGHRRLKVDPHNGLLTDMEYETYPSSYLIHRSDRLPKTVALTFDDGPDPEYTPQVLDALRDLHVPATFFVIGQSAERHPELIRRIWREGHEIGNHSYQHPNFAEISERRARLELNTTQRVIQSILGRSTMLFRPPYNADAEPESPEEVRPIVTASQLGYLTVGEYLDPQDWNPVEPGPDGAPEPRTAAHLADAIIEKVHGDPLTANGNAVLLHDGGGDRSATVQALRLAVPQLQKEGYRFVVASDLAGVPRAVAMPPLGPKDVLLVGLDRVVFEGMYCFETLLAWGFLLAIFLGIGRALFITCLSLVAHRRERRREAGAPFSLSFSPSVSVMIAAYNEAPVIARTIRSILANGYPGLEVVIVDDGSRDGTGDVVEREFAGEPRVRLVRQENAGKAAALNRALKESRSEIVVGLDADTQISPDAIALLVRHFVDPKVAAVAGNVKVGNRNNLLTRWQALEYITSQNLDRRAYGLLNAITVVPGAVGAWRREAVEQMCGYVTDTLAEDMDLTWRLRRKGWKAVTENGAFAYTEAPETMGAFFKQRFRWAYGTLQCLWKHRGALGRFGWFGWLALPTLWLFQIVFQVLAPLIDLQILYTLGIFLKSWFQRALYTQDWQPLPGAWALLFHTGFFYALFFVTELLAAAVALRQDREKPGLLWWLLFQRVVYRQMMYAVVWKSLLQALRGARQGWGKLDRKGTVQLPIAEPLLGGVSGE